MENCLKRQLKGIVNNPNLEKYGVLSFIVTQKTIASGQETNAQKLTITLSSPAKITANGGGHIGNSLSDITHTSLDLVTGVNNVFFENADFTADLSNKYVLTGLETPMTNSTLSIIKYDVNALHRLDALTKIVHNGDLDGKLEEIPASCLTLYITNSNVQGDMSKLSGRNIKSTGNSLIFTICPNLTGSVFGFANDITSYQLVYSSKISGNVEDLVAIRKNAGQTSSVSSIPLQLGGTQVKFNDATVNAQKSLSWVASGDNTVITLGSDTTTIHVNANGSWTRIS